jgi:Spy/CpxP family protein refolding chaperone
MQRKTVILIIGIAVVVLAAIIFVFSYGPQYRYSHMYGPGYGYGPMMGYGHRGMMGPGYGYGPMMGQGYGPRGMMEPGYGYGPMMGPGYGHMGYNALGMMSSELNLADEQSKKLYDLALNYRSKYFENRGNIDELNRLEQLHRKDIENVLTPEQRKIFNTYKRGYDRYGWFGGCPYH